MLLINSIIKKNLSKNYLFNLLTHLENNPITAGFNIFHEEGACFTNTFILIETFYLQIFTTVQINLHYNLIHLFNTFQILIIAQWKF